MFLNAVCTKTVRLRCTIGGNYSSVIVSYHCFIHDMSILVLRVAIALSKSLRTIHKAVLNCRSSNSPQ